MKNQSGQVILILILVMTVGLGIGLSMVQKSLVDVSTASKVEQSSRAFSAAEAGVEKALRGDSSTTFTSDTSKITSLSGVGLIPAVAVSGNRQTLLHLARMYKEDMEQVWLSDPAATLPSCASPYVCYSQSTLEVYWGDPASTIRPAIVLTLIYWDGSNYKSRKWYMDPVASRSGASGNGFKDVSSYCALDYDFSPYIYKCRVVLGGDTDPYFATYGTLPVAGLNKLMAIRVRLLYNDDSQPVAFWATGTCGSACSLPAQARSINSTGVSGETQRRINLFQNFKIVPPYFDYAIFSAGEINK